MAFDRLIQRIDELHNPSVAGLDPRLEYVPQYIRDASFVKYGHTLEAAADAILQFNKALIDALCDVVPAIKPQAAYYEMYGWEGVRTLAETIRYAQSKGMFVMTDGKRNDIGATMTAYATAHLGKTEVDGVELEAFGADALTVNGYLGTDGIQPLLDVCEKYDKGIFVLAKTSNPSSGEFQDRIIDGRPLYEHVGEKVAQWGAECMGDEYSYICFQSVFTDRIHYIAFRSRTSVLCRNIYFPVLFKLCFQKRLVISVSDNDLLFLTADLFCQFQNRRHSDPSPYEKRPFF